MAAGQQHSPNVGCIIQARMKSTRLPGKVLLPIPLSGGKPMIRWIADSLASSRYSPGVIVAASGEPEDDPIEEYCVSAGIGCFRGDEENVLSRFATLARQHDFDVIARMTGDNPVLDTGAFDRAVETHLEQGNGYTVTEGMPLGMSVELVDPKLLRELDMEEATREEREHVTLIFKNRDRYKTGTCRISVPDEVQRLRLTVDYASDYLVVATLLSFHEEGSLAGLDLVKRVFERYPWLFDANRNNLQKKAFDSLEEELREAGKILNRLDMDRAAGLLKDSGRN